MHQKINASLTLREGGHVPLFPPLHTPLGGRGYKTFFLNGVEQNFFLMGGQNFLFKMGGLEMEDQDGRPKNGGETTDVKKRVEMCNRRPRETASPTPQSVFGTFPNICIQCKNGCLNGFIFMACGTQFLIYEFFLDVNSIIIE